MTLNPFTLFRVLTCRITRHEPFPSNSTVQRSRCWRCGNRIKRDARGRWR